MDAPIQSLLFGLFTGLVGLYLGHRLQIGRAAADRRRQFRNVVSAMIEEIRSEKLDFFMEIHERTSRTLPTAAIEVTEDIRLWKRKQFETAWRAYCDNSTKDFKMVRESTVKISRRFGGKAEAVQEQMVRELEAVKRAAK